MSVSLSDNDVAFLDDYARSRGVPSRSAALHRAVEFLRAAELGGAYAEAWREWADQSDAELWEFTTADGLHKSA